MVQKSVVHVVKMDLCEKTCGDLKVWKNCGKFK
jgi:hypothetical protein